MSGWVPSDAELDAVAREVPVADAPRDRVEHNRTAVLAGAASAAQLHSRSPMRLIAAIAIPVAVAAAVLLWLARDREPTPLAIVEGRGSARYSIMSDWPDRVVRVDDGTVDVQLSAIAGSERFRVRAPDAELESTAGAFVATVAGDHLHEVVVATGRVEIRIVGAPPVILAASQSWSRPITAQRDTIEPAIPVTPVDAIDKPTPRPPEPTKPPSSSPTKPVAVASTDRASTSKPDRRTTAVVNQIDGVTKDGVIKDGVTKDPEHPTIEASRAPMPGESQFRDGMTALRNNDPAGAAKSFAVACNAAQAALAEDACFWVGAASRRAGETVKSRDALRAFVQRFPSSARAGEAAALLGWILFETGDVDGAEQQFRRASTDRVPKVRESATRGLTAVERKRGK